MKTLNKSIINLVLFSLLSIPLQCSAGWITNVTPGFVRVISTTGDVTFTPTNMGVAVGCPNNDFYIIKSSSNAKMALSILLSAKALSQPVSIYTPDTGTRCDPATNRPLVYDIGIGNIW